MKKIYILFLYLSLSVILLNASHLTGGEITWKCQGNGSFKFTMKIYRDCNGISFNGTGVSLLTNHPIGSIPLNFVSTTDLSPQGMGCFPCGHPDYNPGEDEEILLESGDVFLNGTPPALGWIFYWSSCCRNGSINNLSNPSSAGFTIRSIMYPYNNQNTNPCFDSSPHFIEKPDLIMCTRYDANYIHHAEDTDLDSLVYYWGEPLNDGPWPPQSLVFNSTYSYDNPLPGPNLNPNNIPAVMDEYTGEVKFTSYTQGWFMVLTKVTAYKCGIKIAEVFREIQLVLVDCPIGMTSPVAYNNPPDVNAPFLNPITGSYDLYVDTVQAGDTVHFFLNATDFEVTSLGLPQTVTLSAHGSQFGTGFIDANSGCLLPPCATLFPLPPISAQFGTGITFQWITECDHLQYDSLCNTGPRAYTFILQAKDDFCPVNSMKYSVITVVVEPTTQCIPLGINNIKSEISQLNIALGTSGSVDVSFYLEQPEGMKIEIIDMTGQIISQTYYDGKYGTNTITVAVPSIAKGMYLLKLGTTRSVASGKFLIID